MIETAKAVYYLACRVASHHLMRGWWWAHRSAFPLHAEQSLLERVKRAEERLRRVESKADATLLRVIVHESREPRT